MKGKIYITAATFGSTIAALFGGMSYAMQLLLICMAADWAIGMIAAGIFHKSKKSENGRLSSGVGFKGICKKAAILLVVLVCHYIDLSLGLTYIMTGAVFGFAANEIVSILENLSLCGVKYPKIIEQGLDILTQKSDQKQA